MISEFYNIIEQMINYFRAHYKYITIFLLLVLVVSMLLFIIVSYFILKFLRISLDNNNILFYQYNKKSKKILDLYGNYKLTKIYLIRQPFSKFITLLLNIITLYN